MTPEPKSKEIYFTCDYNLLLFESLKIPLQTICDKYTMKFFQSSWRKIFGATGTNGSKTFSREWGRIFYEKDFYEKQNGFKRCSKIEKKTVLMQKKTKNEKKNCF